MRVVAGTNSTVREGLRPESGQPSEFVGPAGAPAQCRALARVSPAESRRAPLAAHRPAAAFLAQLIATAQGTPQTRARRRADPAEACAAYAVIAGSS